MGKKTIPSLIRVHKWEVDEKRQALARLQDAQDKLIEARKKQDKELETEKKAALQNPEQSMTFGAYVERYLQKKDELEKMIADLQNEINAARDDLADAFRELKVYEVLQEQHEQAEKLENDRKEQKYLDEIAQKNKMPAE
ncbi:MAG: flagellar FliJ family protein [Alphaproteobacteria bacterium]|nr:flagellar FliJ family protein [Alphaproteobacteria bacterium]